MKGFFSTHTFDGVYKWASSDVKDILGYDSKEMLDHTAYDFFHPDDLVKIVKSHLNVDISTQQVTYRIRKKDGKYIWVRTFSHTLNRGIVALTIKLNPLHLFMYRLFGH